MSKRIPLTPTPQRPPADPPPDSPRPPVNPRAAETRVWPRGSKRQTEFNVAAADICSRLGQVIALIRRFVREHDQTCECAYCLELPEQAGSVLYDMDGGLWGLTILRDMIRNCTVPPDAETLAELGIDLDGFDDDEPLAVEGGVS